MPRQHHEAQLERPIAEAFNALLGVLARGRWSAQLLLESNPRLPPAGMRYEQQRGSVFRCGRVVECIRPVSVTLQETLHDPPCRVELKLRWRLEPDASGSRARVCLDATFDLRGAATFRRRHWGKQIRAHCGRMMQALQASPAAKPAQETSVSGQKMRSATMAVTNVTTDNGRPTFR